MMSCDRYPLSFYEFLSKISDSKPHIYIINDTNNIGHLVMRQESKMLPEWTAITFENGEQEDRGRKPPHDDERLRLPKTSGSERIYSRNKTGCKELK